MPPTRDPSNQPLQVTPQNLNWGATALEKESAELATLRNAFNGHLRTLPAGLGDIAGPALEGVHQVWWLALEMMAQTTAAVADATQQTAVLFEHADRHAVPPPPAPPAPPPPPYDPRRPQVA